MPENFNGFKLLEGLRKRGHDAPAVLITGLGDPEMRTRAERAGAAGRFDKPIDPSVLFSTLVQLLAQGSRFYPRFMEHQPCQNPSPRCHLPLHIPPPIDQNQCTPSPASVGSRKKGVCCLQWEFRKMAYKTGGGFTQRCSARGSNGECRSVNRQDPRRPPHRMLRHSSRYDHREVGFHKLPAVHDTRQQHVKEKNLAVGKGVL